MTNFRFLLIAALAIASAFTATGAGNTRFDTLCPTPLRVSDVGVNTLSLEWPQIEGATSYEVYKEGVFYSTINENRLAVTDLKSFDIYYFNVKAIDSKGTASAWSDTVFVATGETPEQKDLRMRWWREARFGMFCHWGPSAVLAGHYSGPTLLKPNPDKPWIGPDGIMKDYYSAYRPEWIDKDEQIKIDPRTGEQYEREQYAEWIMFAAQIPREEYLERAKGFTADKFDAAQWIALAKQAGMKYFIITAKHHDGMAMIDTKGVGYSILNTTDVKRDLLKELVAQARKEGMHIGFYYSQALDWLNPGGMGFIPQNERWNTDEQKMEYTRQTVIPHLQTMINDYGIDVIWWDMGHESSPQMRYHMMKAIKNIPGTERLIFNNRIADGLTADFTTPEQHIPDMPSSGDGTDWETCMTMNENWGYAAHDQRWKSPEDIIQKLIDIVSKGGNYLLNIGPRADGSIPQPTIDCLIRAGEWMQMNGQAIYATQASPFNPQLEWGRATTKTVDGKQYVYLHVFGQSWPGDGKLAVPKMSTNIHKAYLIGSPDNALEISVQGDKTIVFIPGAVPDPISTTVVLEMDGVL